MNNEKLRDLLFLIRDRDKDAFTELYKDMRGCVYGIAYLYTRSHSDAEDIMQNTFMQIWNKAYMFSGKNARSWIIAIARNFSHDHTRQKQRQTEISEEMPAPDCFDGIFESESIKNIFSCLNEEEREIMVLFSYGFSHREISSIVRRPYATVRWKYSNAMKKLKSISGGEEK